MPLIVSTEPMLQLIANQSLISPTDDNVSALPFLPAEVIVEILLRLPVKYLLQFRCVSKLWKTLISDPKFAKKHFLRSSADPTMNHQRLVFSFRTEPKKIVSCPLNSLFDNPSTPVIPDSFIGLKNGREYDIIGSCNGLLCLIDNHQRTAILYNPFIRLKSKKSPKLASLDGFLIFNIGFGYDHVNDKYKVLVVLKNMASKETLTKIYTFGEDYWRTVQNFFSSPTRLVGKHVSGTLNWVCYKGDFGSEQYVIRSFDLVMETYGEMLLPQNVGDDYVCEPSLYVLSNCLCVFYVNKTHSVLWLMKEYGVVESWTKLTIIPDETIISDYLLDMLFISENGVVLMITLSSKLVLYNINSGRLDFPLTSNDPVSDLHIYRESLISPRW